MTAETPADPRIVDFYNRLLHLLEFTRDMDRNTFDSEFVAASGLVHYVFDENIFEFFVGAHDRQGSPGKPSIYGDKRRYSAQFHQRVWRDKPEDDSREHQWISINRQIAIITSEYLLSGALPGQQDSLIHLTEWHWHELINRLTSLYDHFRVRARSADVTEEPIGLSFEEIERIRELKATGGLTPEELVGSFRQKLRSTDYNLLCEDLDRLRKSKVSSETLLGFVTARLIASIIEEDDLLEPIQQISRLLAKESVTRLRPLHMLLPLKDSDERKVVAEAANDWQDRIRREELERDLSLDRRRKSRRVAADAQSVAYIQFIADRLETNRKERIVFVTGDSLLFDSYRRWWSDNSKRSFIMRRVAQYVPLVNFKDAKSSIAWSDDIFGNTRRAIEPALLYFNLAERPDQPDSADTTQRGFANARADRLFLRRNGGREHFALLLKRADLSKSDVFKVFAEKIGNRVMEERQTEYLKIRNAWQELERLSIGVNYHLIEKRLGNEQRAELSVALELEGTGRGIDAYVNRQLENLYSQSASLFVPAAFSALREWLGSRRLKNFTRRVPIALRLNVPGGIDDEEPSRNILEIVDELISRGAAGALASEAVYDLETKRWLGERPELLFAVAATMALRLALWDLATFYAMLAVGSETAKEIRDKKEQSDQADYYELLYLRALSRRAKMGEISASEANCITSAQSQLQPALYDLDTCVNYHMITKQDGSYHILRTLRARSERAALRLFFVSFVVRRSIRSSIDEEFAIENMLLALDDLRAGQEMREQSKRRAEQQDTATSNHTSSDFYSSVRRQITNNLAAWYVFREILVRHNPSLRDRLVRDDESFHLVLDELGERTGVELPAGIAADINMFLWLFDRNKDALETLRSHELTARNATMQIDVELVELYKREVEQTAAHI